MGGKNQGGAGDVGWSRGPPVRPYRRCWVMSGTPIKVGTPSSRATMEAWERRPPCSTTRPRACPIRKLHPGSVCLATRMSNCRIGPGVERGHHQKPVLPAVPGPHSALPRRPPLPAPGGTRGRALRAWRQRRGDTRLRHAGRLPLFARQRGASNPTVRPSPIPLFGAKTHLPGPKDARVLHGGGPDSRRIFRSHPNAEERSNRRLSRC